MGLILTWTYLPKGIPMMTSSNGNIIRVTGPLRGESTGHRWFPLTKPVTRNFDVFFDLRLNKRLSKHSRRCWFETPSRSLHYDVIVVMCVVFFFQIEAIEDEKKSQDEWKWSEWSGTTLLWYGVAYREPVHYISIEFEIRSNFGALWFKSVPNGSSEILHTSRQCYSRDVCKISLPWHQPFVSCKIISHYAVITN